VNRAQRRAAERQRDRMRAQRRVDPTDAWMRMRIAMLKTDARDLDDESKRGILTPVYLHLQRLQFGTMGTDDFIELCTMNAVAGEIAHQLQFHDDTGQISTAGHACVAAAEALAELGARRGASGRFVATGDELRTLRQAAEYLGELLDLAPRGITLAAMDKIRRNADEKLTRIAQRKAA
jgi:hypothetical protein